MGLAEEIKEGRASRTRWRSTTGQLALSILALLVVANITVLYALLMVESVQHQLVHTPIASGKITPHALLHTLSTHTASTDHHNHHPSESRGGVVAEAWVWELQARLAILSESIHNATLRIKSMDSHLLNSSPTPTPTPTPSES